MEVDKNPVAIFSGDPRFGDIYIDVDTRDLFVLPIQGKLLFVALQVVLHEARYPVILLKQLRILHVLEMLRHVRLRFRAQEGRKRNGTGRHFDCAIRFNHNLLLRRRGCILLRAQ